MYCAGQIILTFNKKTNFQQIYLPAITYNTYYMFGRDALLHVAHLALWCKGGYTHVSVYQVFCGVFNVAF